MGTWEKLRQLIQRAREGDFFLLYPPFRIETKEGDKVGHNSHYRFVWVYSWWKSLFGEAVAPDFILKSPTKARYYAHKALEVALDQGPNAVVDYTYEEVIKNEQEDKKEEI